MARQQHLRVKLIFIGGSGRFRLMVTRRVQANESFELELTLKRWLLLKALELALRTDLEQGVNVDFPGSRFAADLVELYPKFKRQLGARYPGKPVYRALHNLVSEVEKAIDAAAAASDTWQGAGPRLLRTDKVPGGKLIGFAEGLEIEVSEDPTPDASTQPDPF